MSSIYWHFPILIVVISFVYSATRFELWPDIVREAFHWMSRMTMFLGGIAVIMFLIAWLF